MINTSRNQSVSSSWIRKELFDLYKDCTVFPPDVFMEEILANMPDSKIRQLYDKGFCGEAFKKDIETFFIADFREVSAQASSTPGVETYTLAHGEGLDLAKKRFFSAIVELSDVIDANELGVFLISCVGNDRLLDGIDLSSLKRVAGKLSDVVEVSNLQIDWVDYIAPFQSCVQMVVFGATRDKLIDLCELRTKEGLRIFKTARDLRAVIEQGGDAESINKLSFSNKSGYQLFDSAEQYANALRYLTWRRKDEFYSCCEAVDSYAVPVFCYGEDINHYLHANGTAEEAIQMANIRAPDGSRAFTGYEISLLKENNIPFETCVQWGREGCDAVERIYAHKLKLEGVDFVHDGRPKALLLLPTNDSKQLGLVRAFMGEGLHYLTEVSRAYDVCLRAMWCDLDASSAIEEFGSQVALVVLSGHGDSVGIQVARDVSRYNGTQDQKLMLDSSSYELVHSMKKIKSGTVFFLDSCGTAEGAPDSGHFASFIAKNAKQVGLIAASAPFASRDLVIDSLFPHKLKILPKSGATEYTYSAFDGVQIYSNRNVILINAEQCNNRVQPSSVDLSLVQGPLEPMVNIDRCKEAKRLFNLAMGFIFDLETFDKAALMLKQDGVTIFPSEDYSNQTRQQSWQWLFGEYLGKSWCPARGNDFGSESRRIFNDPLGFLTEKGGALVKQPRDGDIIIYYARYKSGIQQAKHPLDGANAYHFGLYADGKVVSKPDGFPVITHELNFPCSDYDLPILRYTLYMRFSEEENR